MSLTHYFVQTIAVVVTKVTEERNLLEGTSKTNAVSQSDSNAFIVEDGLHGKNT